MKKIAQLSLTIFAVSFLIIENIQCSEITTMSLCKQNDKFVLLPNAQRANPQEIAHRELSKCVKQCNSQEKEYLLNHIFTEFLRDQYAKLIQETNSILNNPKLNKKEKKRQNEDCMNKAIKKAQCYQFNLIQFFHNTLSADEIIYENSKDFEKIYDGEVKMARIVKQRPKRTMKVSTLHPVVTSDPIVQDQHITSEKQGLIADLTEVVDILQNGLEIVPTNTINF